MHPRTLLVPMFAIVAVSLASCSGGKGSTGPSYGAGTPTGPSFNLTFPNQGTSQSFTFADSGSWNYHCVVHGTQTSGMFGTVVVTATATSDSAQVDVGVPSLKFNPATVTIRPGGHVRWVNQSTMTNHTVTRP